MSIISSNLLRAIPLLVVMLVVSACGGGGGSSSDSTLVIGATSGTVSIVITDGPSDEFSEILVTVTCARLLGDDGQVTIFEGDETFDLLSLRDTTKLLAVHTDVPAGRYSKLRLCVRQIELIKRNREGDVTERAFSKLTGNGKLDLNPRGDFDVDPGQSLMIEVDWDANKSIKINGKGPNKYMLRPVVFVKIIGKDLPDLDKTLRLHGVIEDLDRDAGTFRLCRTHFENGDLKPTPKDDDGGKDSDHDSDTDSESDSDDNDEQRPERRGCVFVTIDDETAIFAPNGKPVGLTEVENGDEATVYGKVPQDAPLSDNKELNIIALLIELGTDGTFARLTGTATDSVDRQDQFPLDLNPGQGFVDMTSIAVQLSVDGNNPGTIIVNSAGEKVSSDLIQRGEELLVSGVISLDPNLVTASLVVLRELANTTDSLSGEIIDVEDNGRGLRLMPDGGSAERCVRADSDTDVFLITESEDGISSEMIELSDRLNGLPADIYGEENTDGCFDSSNIIVFNDLVATPR